MNKKSVVISAIFFGVLMGCGKETSQAQSKSSVTPPQSKEPSSTLVTNADFKMGYVPDNYSASERDLVKKACANIAVNMVPKLGYSGGLKNIESCNVLITREGTPIAAVSFRDGYTAIFRANPMRVFIGNGLSGNCFFVSSNMTVLKSMPVSAYDLCR